MRRFLFVLSVYRLLLAGGVVAYSFGHHTAGAAPAFTPPTNPYPDGIYAEGIVESEQTSGENINIYPEVAGTVTQIPVAEGQEVNQRPDIAGAGRFHPAGDGGATAISGRGVVHSVERVEGSAEKRDARRGRGPGGRGRCSVEDRRRMRWTSRRPPSSRIRNRSARTPWIRRSIP